MRFNIRWMALALACLASAALSLGQQKPIVRPGIKDVQAPMTDLKPVATFQLGGTPDWLAISEDAIWVANSKFKAVQRINPIDASIVNKIEFQAEPCSGLTFAFGMLWVPLCLKPASLARVDPATNKIIAILPFGPGDSEGGITESDDSVWIVSDEAGTLLRIDPASNSVRQKISIPAGSFNPLYTGGLVWITGNKSGVLTPVDARTGEVLASIPVGPQPRFLTFGAGSIWTLNQGDGSVTRVDAKTRSVTAKNSRWDSRSGRRYLLWRWRRVGHRVRCSLDADLSGIQQSGAAVDRRRGRCHPLPPGFPLAHRPAQRTSLAPRAATAVISRGHRNSTTVIALPPRSSASKDCRATSG